ncbi:MAG: arginase family protein [Thermoleophilia bacterium]|nr:arginase family protein [Thermoleophilia bacterium]
MSRLRARCPYCRTLTAVALGERYECHACGRGYGAGLVRVPRAWGAGGEDMVEAARLPLPFPEVAVVEEDSLAEQNLALAAALPERPLVLGGCCCSHVGAVEGLAARHERVAVVWFDAHGDLNTPETSPSGNEWGMPLRMLIDSGTVSPGDVALVGARALDPPEEDFITSAGVRSGEEGIEAALDGADLVYVALDVDVLDPEGDVVSFMPTPGGPSSEETAAVLRRIVAAKPLAGAGITGATASPANASALGRFTDALGL